MANDAQSSAWSQPFGKYWLDAELAPGGMSRVFRARLRGPGGFEKQLLVKQVLPQLAQDPGFIDLFVREANTLVRMSHPNIVPIYELGVIEGVYFLSMEFIEGATVAELLSDGPLPEALCAQIGLQISEALRYAQERFELAHRDVTPRNVMVDADGHVRLLDFGIAAPLGHGGRGEVFGSEGYMSPEQRRGATLGPASDLFSLGAVLYEALTGSRALEAGRETPLEPASAREPASSVATLVDELLGPEPSTRPASAAQAATRFRTWLAQHHPEGVGRALGERVERARARGARSTTTSQPPPAATPISGGGITRSIATSPQLVDLLAHGTERLPRPASAVAAQRRGVLRGAAVLVGALAAGWFLLRESPAPRPAAIAPAPQPAARPLAPVDAAVPRGAPAPVPAKAAEQAVSAARAPSAPALLSVNALPWADAKLDGRTFGPMPWRARSASAGSHVLTLNCPAVGRKARVPLELRAGTHTRVVVDLRTEPPRISVR